MLFRSLGFHWLDDEHFAIYVVDVCGHGVGAALLSVSALNVLNARTLPGVDFRDPGAVLGGLNATFQMERQNNMFFTIWYGVYHAPSRRLTYSSAAHPAGVLLAPGATPVQLGAPNLPIGVMEGIDFGSEQTTIPAGSRLVVISDGAFEVQKATGGELEFDEFVAIVAGAAGDGPVERARSVIQSVQAVQGRLEFDDDCTLVELQLD